MADFFWVIFKITEIGVNRTITWFIFYFLKPATTFTKSPKLTIVYFHGFHAFSH